MLRALLILPPGGGGGKHPLTLSRHCHLPPIFRCFATLAYACCLIDIAAIRHYADVVIVIFTLIYFSLYAAALHAMRDIIQAI